LSRTSFQNQKLRAYRHTLREVGEPVHVATPHAPDDWRPIVASITPEQRRDETGMTIETPERIEVFVLRDQSDPGYGGIESSLFGLRLKRDPDDDPQAGRIYQFNGEILEQGKHYYRLVFERPRVIRRGK
jgi:hypothetical protein